MKKITLFMLVFTLCLGIGSEVRANSQQIQPEFTFEMSNEGNRFSFVAEFSTGAIETGDYFEINAPFPINLNSCTCYEITNIGGNTWRYVAKDDFESTNGRIEGQRTVYYSNEMEDFELNGEVHTGIDEYPPIPGISEEGDFRDREAFYKIGNDINGKIRWELNITNKENWTMPVELTDTLGDGQRMVGNSLKFYYIEVDCNELRVMDIRDGKGYWEDVEVFDNLTVNDDGFSLDIINLEYGRTLYISYEVDITDTSMETFENEVVLGGNQKDVSRVEVDYSNWSEGHRPKLKDIRVKKVWEIITKNQIIPIEVQLYKDGEVYGTSVILSENNDWTYTFENLPEGEYNIKEITELDNFNTTYEVDGDGNFTIINKEKSPVLPQVGELRIKITDIIAVVLLLLGIAIAYIERKRR